MSKDLSKNYGFVVAQNEEEAREKIIAKFPQLKDANFKLRQDEDCLDTWFSSWLWPISVFDGINQPDNEDIKYYYPTDDLVTAPEIIFFWVARMIMAGEEYRGKEPFKNVYFTGIVRDKLGRKMSKSLGNSPDPIALMEKYGADGVRMGMLLASPAGNDLPFDESLCEQGRNFCNKIWNAFRLIQSWEIEDCSENDSIKNDTAIKWFLAVLQKAKTETEDLFAKYRLSEALTLIYKLFWDDFCSWYLEIIKPDYGKKIPFYDFEFTKKIMDDLLKLLHPFMPFITEELYHNLYEGRENESIMFAQFTITEETTNADKKIADFEKIKEIITNIRNIRASKNISPKEKLTLQVLGEIDADYHGIICKLANVEIETVTEKSVGTVSFLVGTTECAIPIGTLVNVEEEIEKAEKEIARLEVFLKSVNAKLSNEKFVAHAPANVIEMERKKQSDAQSKIKALNDNINELKKK
jgi:valyl-tRNA synthetase